MDACTNRLGYGRNEWAPNVHELPTTQACPCGEAGTSGVRELDSHTAVAKRNLVDSRDAATGLRSALPARGHCGVGVRELHAPAGLHRSALRVE